jgi:hypothetical protein
MVDLDALGDIIFTPARRMDRAERILIHALELKL